MYEFLSDIPTYLNYFLHTSYLLLINMPVMTRSKTAEYNNAIQTAINLAKAAHAEMDMSKRYVIINELVVFYICDRNMNHRLKYNETHRNIMHSRCIAFLASDYCTPTLRHTAGVLLQKIEQMQFCDIYGKWSLKDF
jgi:hypothetical protein